jgi:hypothetical protein
MEGGRTVVGRSLVICVSGDPKAEHTSSSSHLIAYSGFKTSALSLKRGSRAIIAFGMLWVSTQAQLLNIRWR